MEKVELNWSKLINLEKESIEQLENNVKGVYRLSYRNDDKNIYVFFIGKHDNIKEQLLNHISSHESNFCIQSFAAKERFFKFAAVTEDYIDLVYQQMYKIYQPACNTDKLIVLDDVISININ